jgi:hypothetical protein
MTIHLGSEGTFDYRDRPAVGARRRRGPDVMRDMGGGRDGRS